MFRPVLPLTFAALLLVACNQKKADLSHAKAVAAPTSSATATPSSGPSSIEVNVDGKKVTVGDTAGDCKAGAPCTCTGLGTCKKSCPAGGCELTCSNTGTCELDCAGGNCKVTSTGMGNVSVACASGNCSLTCSGTGTCTITSCKSGCSTSCTGGQTVCKCTEGC